MGLKWNDKFRADAVRIALTSGLSRRLVASDLGVGLSALNKWGAALRQSPKGCVHHTDRGSQYCSHDDQRLLRQHGLQVSMGGKGNCCDNSAVETFFKKIKAELIWRQSWQTRRDAELAIFQYINGFYNPRRRHSALDRKSPIAFERKVAKTCTWGGTKTGRVHIASQRHEGWKLLPSRCDDPTRTFPVQIKKFPAFCGAGKCSVTY